MENLQINNHYDNFLPGGNEMKKQIKNIPSQNKCFQCDWEWTPRVGYPKRCPKCISANWDKPKKETNGK